MGGVFMAKRIPVFVLLVLVLLFGAACSVLGIGVTDDAPAAVDPQIPGRPDAPAAPDGDFRADPVSLIAATGRPQFVEVFAFW
jgi:hypothetical protein